MAIVLRQQRGRMMYSFWIGISSEELVVRMTAKAKKETTKKLMQNRGASLCRK